jgi:hypothetical protein
VLYEDDAVSVAYKKGEVRTTRYNASFNVEQKLLTVVIDAANGTFKGSRGFETRNVKVRVHIPVGWGKVVRGTVGDKEVSVNSYNKDPYASPFTFSNEARDSDVAEICFESNVRISSVIRFFFDSVNDPLPVNPDMNETRIGVVTEDIQPKTNLTEEGPLDWFYLKSEKVEESVRKKIDVSKRLISD